MSKLLGSIWEYFINEDSRDQSLRSTCSISKVALKQRLKKICNYFCYTQPHRHWCYFLLARTPKVVGVSSTSWAIIPCYINLINLFLIFGQRWLFSLKQIPYFLKWWHFSVHRSHSINAAQAALLWPAAKIGFAPIITALRLPLHSCNRCNTKRFSSLCRLHSSLKHQIFAQLGFLCQSFFLSWGTLTH